MSDRDEKEGTGQGDKARGGRPPSTSVRLARVGVELAKGAPSMYRAALEAGYSPATARSAKHNGITVRAALAAAQKTFPSERKTLKSLKPRAIAVLDKGMELEEGERPDSTHLQASALALKLGAEVGDDEPDGVTPVSHHNFRRFVRLACRRFGRSVLRRALVVGVEATLAELLEFEAHEKERFPRLAELDTSAPRFL